MLWTSSVLLRKNIEQHDHNVHEMIVCLTGSVDIQINDKHYHLLSGHSAFIPAQCMHAINLAQQTDTKLLFVCIAPPAFEMLSTPTNRLFLNTLSTGKCLINNGFSSINNNIDTHNDSLVKSQKNEMLLVAKELADTPNVSSPLCASLKEALYLRLLFTHLTSLGYVDNTNAIASLRISNAQSWIDKNYALEITLEMVAKQVNMSRSHFARQFRQYTGFSVIEYLLKIRCDAAANLLANSTTDITETAFATGFSNLSHFYRHFKRRYGITPKAFRQMISHQGISESAKSA